MSDPTRSVWRMVRSGGRSKEKLLKELEGAGLWFGKIYVAENSIFSLILNRDFLVTPAPMRYEVMRCTVRDLGFESGAAAGQVWGKVLTIGHLCPPDLAIAIRLAYMDQPEEEYAVVVMHPLPACGPASESIIILGKCEGVPQIAIAGWQNEAPLDPDIVLFFVKKDLR